METKTLLDIEREKLARELHEMKADLTPGEMATAAKKLEMTDRNVYQYLSGKPKNIKKIETGRKIYQYFESFISKKRTQLLSAV